MGNAVCTIHHPTSLGLPPPYLSAGREAHIGKTGCQVRFVKRDGTACGVGGRQTFKRNVQESQWSYKYTKTTRKSLSIEYGAEVSVAAQDAVSATEKIAVKFGISQTEAKECFLLVKNLISDKNVYSELYFYVDFNGLKNGRYYWIKNDLKLKATHRWAPYSEMIIDIKFR